MLGCTNKKHFQCKHSKKCVPKEWICDGENDCGLIGKFNLLDNSDEEINENCTKKCEKNELLCSNNNVCLPISKFCDGNYDCQNDERNCADHMMCATVKCDFDCKNTPYGPKCFCPTGQEIVNGTKCVDLDECNENVREYCDQLCDNLPNSYKCSCAPGYEMYNNKCLGINSKLNFLKKSFSLNFYLKQTNDIF